MDISKQHTKAKQRARKIYLEKKKSIDKMFRWIDSHYLHHDADIPIYKFRGKKWYSTAYDSYRCYIKLRSQYRNCDDITINF